MHFLLHYVLKFHNTYLFSTIFRSEIKNGEKKHSFGLFCDYFLNLHVTLKIHAHFIKFEESKRLDSPGVIKTGNSDTYIFSPPNHELKTTFIKYFNIGARISSRVLTIGERGENNIGETDYVIAVGLLLFWVSILCDTHLLVPHVISDDCSLYIIKGQEPILMGSWKKVILEINMVTSCGMIKTPYPSPAGAQLDSGTQCWPRDVPCGSAILLAA